MKLDCQLDLQHHLIEVLNKSSKSKIQFFLLSKTWNYLWMQSFLSIHKYNKRISEEKIYYESRWNALNKDGGADNYISKTKNLS